MADDIIATYNDNAEIYARSSIGTENRKMLDQFADLVKQPAKVLDVGCAAGRDSRILQDIGYDVTGIDLADKLLAIAKKSHPDITFTHADMRDLPFENASFDGVWCSGVLHHIKREEMPRALAEFHRVLKPGSVLHVYTKAGQGTLRTQESSVNNAVREFNLLTLEELDTLLETAGFDQIPLKKNRASHALTSSG